MDGEIVGAAPIGPPNRGQRPRARPADLVHGAASPQDVQRQTEGQPTAAQQAQGHGSSSLNATSASGQLDLARILDRQGNEAECLTAVGRATLLSGAR